MDFLLSTKGSFLIEGPGALEEMVSKVRRLLPSAEWVDLRDGTSAGSPRAEVTYVALLGPGVRPEEVLWLTRGLSVARVIALSTERAPPELRRYFDAVLALSAALRPSATRSIP